MKPPRKRAPEMTDEELRREIATLLGWTWNRHAQAWDMPGGQRCYRPLRWSTDIAAAWALVEMMAAGGAVLYINVYHTESGLRTDIHIATGTEGLSDAMASSIGEPSARAICECFVTWKREGADRGR